MSDMNNKLIMRVILLSMMAILGARSVLAQGVVAPFLATNPDVRSMGMGSTMLGSSESHALYTNPAAPLYADSKYFVDFSPTIYPQSKDNDVTGRNLLYAVSLGFKLADRHMLFGGFRYLGGESYKFDWDVAGRIVEPFDWTIDLGYSYRLNEELALFATGSFLQTYVNKVGRGAAFSLGANYHKMLLLGASPAALNLGLSVSEIGGKVSFEKSDLKGSLPTSIRFGGDLSILLSQDHQLAVALSGRYFTPKDMTQKFLGGMGLEYGFRKMLSVRAGYEFGDQSYSMLTVGAGGQFHGFTVDLAYRHSLSNFAGNTVSVGIGWRM